MSDPFAVPRSALLSSVSPAEIQAFQQARAQAEAEAATGRTAITNASTMGGGGMPGAGLGARGGIGGIRRPSLRALTSAAASVASSVAASAAARIQVRNNGAIKRKHDEGITGNEELRALD